MAAGQMRKIAPRLYWAGRGFMKPGLTVWLGPSKPKPFSYKLPRWRRLHHRHVRILPVPKRLLGP